MSQWDDIRRLARHYRAQMRARAGADTAAALLRAAAEATGITPVRVADGDPLLYGAQAHLDAESGVIWYNHTLDAAYLQFLLAHEYAHYWLEGTHACTCRQEDIDPESGDAAPSGAQRVEGYSPAEWRERKMNLFAREFLLPGEVLRAWYLGERLNAHAIAARVGVPEAMVYHQLMPALLLPAEAPAEAPAAEAPLTLDDSQREAAHVARGPRLVEAGPGTGKTRTLTGRVLFLLRTVAPEHILALTFSNRAAHEMRERVARVAPDAAPHIWMGTFHAYGLDLLRRHGAHIGLPPRPRVLDPVDALELLEEMLPELGLVHYQNLYEPTTNLHHILKAIGRAKDDLVTPEQYQDAVRHMQETVGGPEAEKALEVARVYAAYQQRLAREGALDFGDLIARAVALLRAHPQVRAQERRRYAHILVDEYQDVNRASGLLLREIAGDGRGLWAVGDVRQSIYRFRGATPVNIQRFAEDFPGAPAPIVLGTNYRSRPAVLDTVAALVPHMRVQTPTHFTPWEPARDEDRGHVRSVIADDLDTECRSLAQAIAAHHDAGVPYRDQAILCRSHTTLARIAQRLERHGVPVVYLGDLFERPEIRDLLALLALAAGDGGTSLVRVARFGAYQIPLADVRALIRLARDRQVPFPRALALADDAPLSDAGREGVRRLAADIDGLCHGTTAWSTLTRYLFDRTDHIRALAEDDSAAGQQRRLAILQVLLFAYAQRERREDGMDPKRALLRYVRRLEMLGEDRQLRQIPEAAGAIDAVHLMTVHAAKGLEFPVVYIPALGKGLFPLSRQAVHCPPPPSLPQLDSAAGHEEEEECLFFVALSRARDALHLSRARRYRAGQTSTPSDLLAALGPHLGAVTEADGAGEQAPVPEPPPMRLPLPLGDPVDVLLLDQYLRCPRQLYYESALGLSGRREDDAYQRFHRCVQSVIRWLQDERARGRAVDEDGAVGRLAHAWEERGPTDHPYAAIYRESANRILRQAVRTLRRPAPPEQREPWVIPLENGAVRLEPDHVELTDDGEVVVQRLRTGKLSQGEGDKDIYALYQLGAAQAYAGRRHRVEIKFLSTDETSPVALSSRKITSRLQRYTDALAGIRAGHFPPTPDERACPRCPFYFICPAAEEE